MKGVTIAEGKKGFSQYVREAAEKDEEIIITKRGTPVAVIVPYERYKNTKRVEGYKKIMEAREAFSHTTVSADEVYRASKSQLERRK